ncbi:MULTISPECIES: hypothetical protein [unclassified Paenibacillus]|uniref:hypothetical protein n=1 Tax=unclassified Paenibacillus TaxID=185978 RepID=UPI0030FA9CEA
MSRKKIFILLSAGLLLLISVVLIGAGFLGPDVRVGYGENSYGNKLNASFYYFNGTNTKKLKFNKGDQVKMTYSIELSKGTLQMKVRDEADNEVFLKTEGSGEVDFIVDKTQNYEIEIKAIKAKGKYTLDWSK